MDPQRVRDFLDGGRTERAQWLRLVALLAFDRLLHLPLDRSLIDAEIAVAQYGVARTLPEAGGLREHLVRSALVRARDAAPGLCRYIEHLVVLERRPPRILETALERIAGGYRAFADEVRGPDAELAAVTEAWHRLSLLDGEHCRMAPAAVRAPAPPARDGAGLVDPRMVPARLLDLGPTAHAAEIDVTRTQWKGRSALRVRVPAFGVPAAGVIPPDLGVRLVDRRSGDIRSYGLLGEPCTAPAGSLREADDRYYEGIVELPDAIDPQDVRVDLANATDRPRRPAADDAELLRVRRATLFLAGWRALVADVRLWGEGAAPAARLRDITRRLEAESGDGPLWAGGPSAEALRRLAGLGDRALAALLVAGDDPVDAAGSAPVAATVRGPGDLLVAEVAAAFERSAV